ncbi:MAG: hypothetical protein ACLTZY_13260 [Alistipes indistinctus]
MMIYAYRSAVRMRRRVAAAGCSTRFNEVAVGVCEGQQYDMDFENARRRDGRRNTCA